MQEIFATGKYIGLGIQTVINCQTLQIFDILYKTKRFSLISVTTELMYYRVTTFLKPLMWYKHWGTCDISIATIFSLPYDMSPLRKKRWLPWDWNFCLNLIFKNDPCTLPPKIVNILWNFRKQQAVHFQLEAIEVSAYFQMASLDESCHRKVSTVFVDCQNFFRFWKYENWILGVQIFP